MTAAQASSYSRVVGVLLLVSIVAGGFGEFFAPSAVIVPGNAGATAQHILASESYFRLGFASYLVEAVCDTALAFLFFALLMPVDRNLAMMAAFFRLISTATFAIAEFCYLAAIVVLKSSASLTSFTPGQLNDLAYLAMKLYSYGGSSLVVFYGTGSLIFGYLIYRANYLPKWLGVLVALGGMGFIVRSFVLVLAPTVPSELLLLPTMLAMIATAGWFIVKGIDMRGWTATNNSV